MINHNALSHIYVGDGAMSLRLIDNIALQLFN